MLALQQSVCQSGARRVRTGVHLPSEAESAALSRVESGAPDLRLPELWQGAHTPGLCGVTVLDGARSRWSQSATQALPVGSGILDCRAAQPADQASLRCSALTMVPLRSMLSFGVSLVKSMDSICQPPSS